MRQKHSRLRLLGLCASVLALLPTALLSLWVPRVAVFTEDRNADGRPDVWRRYDRQGLIATVSVDTNFDGRSDIQEFYDGGVLQRRDSDRNFNSQVDLVQEFDSATHDEVRAVSDDDFDGEADLLVSFADGQPTVSELRSHTQTANPVQTANTTNVETATQASQSTPAAQADDRLTPLRDPFAQELAVRAVKGMLAQPISVGTPSSNGLTTPSHAHVVPFAPSRSIVDNRPAPLLWRSDDQCAPRGPPALLSL